MAESSDWKAHFPKGFERRSDVSFRLGNAERAKRNREITPDFHGGRPEWGSYDSSLDKRGFDSFWTTFCGLLPPSHRTLKGYIESELKENKGQAIGIEFGGPGSKVFSEFSKGFFKKTAGVTLVDNREFFLKDPRAVDKKRNHQVIPGNIFSKEIDQAVLNWLGGEKLDLIFERMFGGLLDMPNEPYMLAARIQSWYSLLREGGLMLIEVPRNMEYLIEPWAKMVEAKYGRDKIQIIIAGTPPGAFSIKKLKDAPAELPLFGPMSVRRVAAKDIP